MRKRIAVSMWLVVIGILTLVGYSMAYGVDLSFPGIRRSEITQGYSGSHQAIDYRFANHDIIAAPKAGEVTSSRWIYSDDTRWWPCYGSSSDRGNYIILDHGGAVETRHYHLSNQGSTPGVGANFHLGDEIAYADNTGCSTGAHLHFVLRVNSNPVDPYAGTTHWVSGAPIPMGFRDQGGNKHGPFPLDWTSIRDKWLELEGEPGAPVDDDFEPMLATIERRQSFEHGYIHFVIPYGPQYMSYHKTYLPDIRIDHEGWDSTIIVRSNGGTARVNVTFYDQDGKMVDSRTHTGVSANGTWLLNTSDLANDWTNPVNNFSGSAVVYSNQDVSVAVKNTRSSGITSYSGIGEQGSGAGWDEPGQTAYVPASLRNYYGWDSVFYIQNTGSGDASGSITFYNEDGSPKYPLSGLSIPANGQMIVKLDQITNLGNGFSGSAVISFDQPVAVIVRQDGGSSGYSDFNAFTSGADVLYLPSLLSGYYGWDSAYQVQNVGTQDTTVTVRYEFDGSDCTRSLGTVKAKAYKMEYQPTDPCFTGKNIGSARLTSSNGQPIVAIVNQQNSTGSHQSYSALLGGATTLVAPFFTHDVGGWNSSLQAQNMDSATARVWRTYYETDGDQALSMGPDYLAPRKSKAWIGGEGVPSGYYYSAVVTSDQEVGGISNTSRSGSGDVGCSYNMIPR
jgi:hypothetical protein